MAQQTFTVDYGLTIIDNSAGGGSLTGGNGAVNITADDLTNSATWTFDPTGNLTLPNQANIVIDPEFNNTTFNGAANSAIKMQGISSGGFSIGAVEVFGDDADNGHVSIYTANTADEFDSEWLFNPNGTITFPNQRLIGDATASGDFKVTSTANISILANLNPTTEDSGSAGYFVSIGAGYGANSTIEGTPSGPGGNIYISAGQGGQTVDYATAGLGGTVRIEGGQTWNFTAPGGNIELVGGQGIYSTVAGNIRLIGFEAGNAEFSSQTGVFSVAGNIMTGNYFVGDGGFLSNIQSSIQPSIADGNSSVAVDGVDGNVLITTNGGGGGIWSFDTNGALKFPEDTAYIGSAANTLTLHANDSEAIYISDISGGISAETNGNVTLIANVDGDTNYAWTFNNDGTMSFPSNIINSGSNPATLWSTNNSKLLWRSPTGGAPGSPVQTIVSANDGNATISVATGTVLIQSISSWTFDTAGNTTFPDASVQTTAYPGTATSLLLSGNITGGNIIGTHIGNVTGTTASLSGNVTGGNILTGGLISATGNISGGNIIGTHVGNLTGTTASLSGNVTSGNVLTGGRVSATGNILGGNLTVAGNAVITYTPATTTGSGLLINAANTQGGTGFADFLRATNTSTGATNPSKTIRLNSTGGIEIINNAYTATLLTLTDAGALSVASTVSGTGFNVNNKQAVNGPAFSAYASSSTTIPTDVLTKVNFQSEEYDTNSNFASSRFTPTVEGYYQFNSTVRMSGSSGTGEMMIVLYKNGAEYHRGWNSQGVQIGSGWWSMGVSSTAYANGTGDYFEIYVQQGSAANRDTTSGATITWFNGCMLRGA